MENNKHRIMDFGPGEGRRFCLECGLLMNLKTAILPCPPWELAQRGDTSQPSSHLGAGVVNQLREICDLLQAGFVLAKQEEQVRLLEKAYNKLDSLIITLEDQG